MKYPAAPPTIKDPDAPPNLYKYQAINEQTLANLRNSVLWASNVTSFNDPFEHAHVRTGGDPHETLELFYKTMDNFTVICLTEKYDDILMWSHYADQHRGLCMHFEMTSLRYRVNYQDDYPTIDFDEDEPHQIMAFHKLLHTKSNCWKYEGEHRQIFVTPPKAQPYPGKLTSIFFGLRTSAEDMIRVYEILGDTVQYYKCYISPDKYAIVIAKCPMDKLKSEKKGCLSFLNFTSIY